MSPVTPTDETRQRMGNSGIESVGTFHPLARLKLAVRGAVQGVGFRPFVYRLATALGLAGWVNHSPQGVFIPVPGDAWCPRCKMDRAAIGVDGVCPTCGGAILSRPEAPEMVVHELVLEE